MSDKPRPLPKNPKKTRRPAPVARRRMPKVRTDRGPLHQVLTEKLPDLRGPGGVCDLHRLALELGMTHQGVYKWMKPGRPNQLPFAQVKRIVALSERQSLRGLDTQEKEQWSPATEADFFEFIV